MSSTTIETLVKMMESVPEPARDQVLERVREYLADVLDDLQWDHTFEQSKDKFNAMADRAHNDIQAGLAQPFDADEL